MVAYLTDVRLGEDAPTEGYPWSLPAVRRVADLRFGDVTVLVGDNGTGKSTLPLATDHPRGPFTYPPPFSAL